MPDHQHSIFTDRGSLDPDPADLDPIALHAQVVAAAQAKLKAGQNLSREEHKAIREAAVYQLTETHWSDRAAIAESLGVSPKAVERYKAEGAPIESHAPTAKEPVYLWLIDVLRQQGGKVANDSDPRRQRDVEDARWRRIRNDEREGLYVAEAEAAALEGVTTVFRALKAELLHAVPARIGAAAAGLSRRDLERLIQDTIRTTLTALADQAGALDDLETPTNTNTTSAQEPTHADD